MNKLTQQEAIDFVAPFFDKPISLVYQSHGSCIFFEVGELTEDKGEMTIQIDWSWRIEKENKIAVGSWSDESEWAETLNRLEGKTLKSIAFPNRLPELAAELSDDMWICSFSTIEGNPEWSITAKGKTMVSIQGTLAFT